MRLILQMALLSFALACTAGCGGGGGGGGVGLTQRSINLSANDLVFDPFSQRIYASIPSSAGAANGDSVAAIDPRQATVVSRVVVGGAPNLMAVSDDGQFLYVVQDDIGTIRRFTLPALTPDIQFSLGADPAHVTEMAVLPHNPHSLVVAMNSINGIPWGMRIAIFDDGVLRPNTFDSSSFQTSQAMVCGSDGTVVYDYRYDGFSNVLLTLLVDGSGLTQVGANSGLLSVPDGGLQIHAGRIFSSAGRVIDEATLTPLGTLPVTANQGFTVDENRHIARYFYDSIPFGVPYPDFSLVIESYNTDRFVMTSKVSLPVPEFSPTSSLRFSRVAQWSSGTAAFSVTNSPFDGDPAKVKSKIFFFSNLPQ